MLYKLMPRAKIAWRDVWSAGSNRVLFEIGKFLIRSVSGKTSVASGFGRPAGSLVSLWCGSIFCADFLLGA